MMLIGTMWRLLLVVFLSLALISAVPAQPCQQLTHISHKQRKVLKDYIRHCEAWGFLKGDTGVVMLHQLVDPLGQTEWSVGVKYQDEYRDQKPPIGWSMCLGKLILWYAGFGFTSNPELTAEQESCLAQIVGKRITKRPPVQRMPVLVNGQPLLDKNGEPITVPIRALNGGGDASTLHIIFKNDGSVSISQSV